MKIGLIGFGRFGRFAWKHLHSTCDVVVYDRRPFKQRGVNRVSLAEAASRELVVLCVPISQLETVCRQIAPHIRSGALVVDTCSVKVRPLEILESLLPADAEILGTHPLFGPDSGKEGIAGLKIVLCPVRTRRARTIAALLRRMRLRVLTASPAEHDRAMAQTQALFHFVARATAELGIKPLAMSTPGPDYFLRLAASVLNDSDQLFCDLQTQNTHAGEVRRQFINQLIRIDERLTKRRG